MFGEFERVPRSCMLAFIVVNLISVASIQGATFKADLKVCLQSSNGAPVENANVKLKGGSKVVSLKLVKSDGCYINGGIIFDDARTYSLEVAAEHYETKEELLGVLAAPPNGLLIHGPIILKAIVAPASGSALEAVTPPPPSPSPSPTGKDDWLNTAFIAFLVDLTLVLVAGLALGIRSLLRRKGSHGRPPINSTGGHSPSLAIGSKDFKAALELLVRPLEGIEAQQKHVVETLTKIFERLPSDLGADGGSNDASTPAQDVLLLTALSDRDQSIVSYERFLSGESSAPEPIYLSDVGGSSMKNLLGRKKTTLEESSQGAIILFQSANGDGWGWIYPNTRIFYQDEELKSAFPNLTPEQFQCLKHERRLNVCNVEPVPVRQDPDTRQWQVEPA